MNLTVRFTRELTPSALPFLVERLSSSKTAIPLNSNSPVIISDINPHTGNITCEDGSKLAFKTFTGFTFSEYREQLHQVRTSFLQGTNVELGILEHASSTDIDDAKRLVSNNQHSLDLTTLGSGIVFKLAAMHLLGARPLPEVGTAYTQKTWEKLNSFKHMIWLPDAIEQASALDAELQRLTNAFLPDDGDFADTTESVVMDDIEGVIKEYAGTPFNEGKDYYALVALEFILKSRVTQKLRAYDEIIDDDLYLIDMDLIPGLLPQNIQLAKYILRAHFHCSPQEIGTLDFYWGDIFDNGVSPTVIKTMLQHDRTLGFRNLSALLSFQAACAKFHADASLTSCLAADLCLIATQNKLTLTTDKEPDGYWWWSLRNDEFSLTTRTETPWDTSAILLEAWQVGYQDFPNGESFAPDKKKPQHSKSEGV